MNFIVIKPCSMGLELILNGNKDVLDSATVPTQWFFTPEVAAKEPKFIILIEHSESELAEENYEQGKTGRRHLCRVSKTIDFIGFDKPGRHRVIALAVEEGTESKNAFKELFKEYAWDYYHNHINPEDIYVHMQNGLLPNIPGFKVVAATIKEFTIPEELFAKKPQGAFGGFIWNWVNLWYEKSPVDQCAFRKRCIFAFTLKPFIFLITAIVRGLLSTLGSFLTVATRLVIFFFGYRPAPIFSDLGGFWVWDFSEITSHFPNIHFHPKSIREYRYWGYSTQKARNTYMPVTPIELLGVTIVLSGMAWLHGHYKLTSGYPAVSNIMLECCLTLFSYFFLQRFLFKPLLKWFDEKYPDLSKPRRKTKVVAKPEPVTPSEYSNWLANNLVVSKAPDHVDLTRLPSSYRGKFRQVFRVGFWATKMKVCRPYSR